MAPDPTNRPVPMAPPSALQGYPGQFDCENRAHRVQQDNLQKLYMTALQATFGLTTLSSDGAFAVHMLCFFVPEYFDVVLPSLNCRGSH